MRVLFFGTYDASVHTRVKALLEGFREHGDDVMECNIPLDLSTGGRVALLRRPWRTPLLLFRLARLWLRLFRRARRLPAPDAVVVGYLGHFDIHLARLLWRRTPLALDFLVSGADTARDRGIRSRALLRLLEAVDRAAVARADVSFVDTDENRALLPPRVRERAVVVPVGAPAASFRLAGEEAGQRERAASEAADREAADSEVAARDWGAGIDRLRVVFFGTFTPLQGAVTIARAIADLADAPIDFLVVGRGQDYDAAREIAAGNPNVSWVDWLEPKALPVRLAREDVCLGIFGTGRKAQRVVPNKVCHGAAAGCAIVTSDTPPQRRALGDAAVLVRAGNAAALAEALRSLASDPGRVARLRDAAAARAREVFAPEAVVIPLREELLERIRKS